MTRDDLEPYLAALLQAEHLNVLFGAGLGLGLAAAVGIQNLVGFPTELAWDAGVDEELIVTINDATDRSTELLGRGPANLEDKLRVAAQVYFALEAIGDPRGEAIHATVDATLKQLVESVSAMERSLSDNATRPTQGAGMTLEALLGSLLSSFAGRAATRDRLHIFTTNYDRIIEWGAERAGLRQIDRFVGSLEPEFRSSRLEFDYHYSPPGSVREPRHLDGVFRLTKLHGSLDWIRKDTARNVRRRPMPFGTSEVSVSDCIIYPNSTKDQETGLFPYAELFRDFAAAICRPNSVLITYGFSFGDSHINRIIADMLTLPSTHLLIISHDDDTGRIERFVSETNLRGQVSRMIGANLADLSRLVEDFLPWIPGPAGAFPADAPPKEASVAIDSSPEGALSVTRNVAEAFEPGDER